ncbi:MAG: prepilin-type N-terminal cleavage/methylation domain-containing protein [Planctomycetota bacterium]
MRTARITASARAGFTLVELLAVMLILGLLLAILVPNLLTSQEATQINATRSKLALLASTIDAYEHEKGSYPPSHYRTEWGVAPNELNVGVECLVLSLWSNNWDAGGQISADELQNTDGDRSAGTLSDLGTSELMEFVDPWGQPIAYFESGDYGTDQRYLCLDENNQITEQIVRARKNERIGRYLAHGKYQLVSAGPDGRFGTDDDVVHPRQ